MCVFGGGPGDILNSSSVLLSSETVKNWTVHVEAEKLLLNAACVIRAFVSTNQRSPQSSEIPHGQ